MSESPITTCSVQPRESIELPIVKETEQKNKEYGDEEVDIEEDSKHDEGDNDVGQDTISDHNVFTIFFWNEVNKFQEFQGFLEGYDKREYRIRLNQVI